MLDPLLAADGRRARGRLTLNAGIAGTAAAPQVSGTARLANGDIQDFAGYYSLVAIFNGAKGDYGYKDSAESIVPQVGP